MGNRAQRIPSWPGVIHSNKGRIHSRRPTCDILTFRLRRSGGPYIPSTPSLGRNFGLTSDSSINSRRICAGNSGLVRLDRTRRSATGEETPSNNCFTLLPRVIFDQYFQLGGSNPCLQGAIDQLEIRQSFEHDLRLER